MNSDDNSANLIIAILDANIVLEGKPVTDLPWEEVATVGTIRALIVPKAMEEIDAKKRDGRLGLYARKFNHLIGDSVTEGRPIIIREADPRVELAMATCSRIPWDDYGELDPDDGDSRIVAEALNIQHLDTDRIILISHDIKPLAYARGRGMPIHRASDAWLRPIEPSPKDKEIQRLKGQVAEFKKDEPTFEILIEVSDIDPPTIYKVSPLASEEAEALTRVLRAQTGRKKPNGDDGLYGLGGLGGLNNRDSSYDGKYRTHIDKTIPRFVAAYNEKLELLFNQRLLTIKVSNTGQIRADHLVISVNIFGGWINDNLVAVSPTGPSAPVPRPDYLSYVNMHSSMRDLISPRVGRHEFETIMSARRGREMQEICEDFRSGQDYVFKGVVAPYSTAEPLEITVSLTAANLRGKRIETFRVDKQIIEVLPGKLIDLETLKLLQDFPTKNELERLIGLQRYSDLEWDQGGGDD